MKIDWKGETYIGIDIQWDYDKGEAQASQQAIHLSLTELTNLERLYNSRIRLPAVAAAMVRLVNRLSNTTYTQLS